MIRTPLKKRDSQPSLTIEKHKGYYDSLGYRSASTATSEGRSYTSYPGSAHEEKDRLKLVNQSREFLRDNSIYKGMIEQMINYVIGNGFELQLSGASDTAVAKGEGLWRNWNRRPEIRNVLSGSKVARMVLRELIVAGDTAVLKTDKGLIQHFESEQIDGKKPYVNGILKDELGKPLKYKLCPWKNYTVDTARGKEVGAENVMFITSPERPSQTRGVPACQAAFPMLHRINDVCDSEAIAWQLLSRLAITITREQGPVQAYTESKEDPNKSSDDLEGDLATRLIELDYAIIHHANPGESVKGIERNIPGMNFSESLRMFLRLLGLPLGLPLELILLDWTNSNYSQSRAVLEQAYENFIGWQQEIEDFYYRPLFEWKIEQWKDEGLIAKSVNFNVEWIKKTFPWIDQLKEAEAYATQVERAFTTHTKVCKSLNSDQSEVVAQRAVEIQKAITISQEIEKKTGVKVAWEYFAGVKPGVDKKELAKTGQDDKNNEQRNEDGAQDNE